MQTRGKTWPDKIFCFLKRQQKKRLTDIYISASGILHAGALFQFCTYNDCPYESSYLAI